MSVHYGKRFAQTQELLEVRVMNHELEHLAGLEEPKKGSTVPLKTAKPNGVPIGALPGAETIPETLALEGLLDMAVRQVRTAQSAALELGKAGFRILSFPLDAAKLLAQRFRLLDA